MKYLVLAIPAILAFQAPPPLAYRVGKASPALFAPLPYSPVPPIYCIRQTGLVVSGQRAPDFVRFQDGGVMNFCAPCFATPTGNPGEWRVTTPLTLFPWLVPGRLEISAGDSRSGVESAPVLARIL